jgi:hypothetical protein
LLMHGGGRGGEFRRSGSTGNLGRPGGQTLRVFCYIGTFSDYSENVE